MMAEERVRSTIDPALASRILKSVPMQEAFMFFTDMGQYTGESSSSLTDFFKKLTKIPLKSIDFHFKRGDFEKWIREVLGDEFLANEISKIDRTIHGEELRTTIQSIVKRRLDQLEFVLFQRTSTTLFSVSKKEGQ